jgi:hypothetical protein
MTTPEPPPGVGITMLGGPETGKTTFLAALQIALLRRVDLGWSLVGDNPGSRQAMVKFMDQMTRGHAFPAPTSAQLEEYRWSLVGEARRVREWRWWRIRSRIKTVRVPLHLVDAPGAAADGRQIYARDLSAKLIGSLADSAGIVLFFDPLSEAERGEAFQHMYGVLTELRSQAAGHERLPHYVAVCLTKFDAIPIFLSAQRLAMVRQEPEGAQLPFVPDEDAEEFFARLIRRSRADDASLILPLLKQTFYEDRVKFFITSAIGFYVDPSMGLFDPDDYQNHVRGKPDRIRGGVRPINVVEPILWLGKNMAKVARQ